MAIQPRNNLFALLQDGQTQFGEAALRMTDGLERVEHTLPDPAVLTAQLNAMIRMSEALVAVSEKGMRSVDEKLAALTNGVAGLGKDTARSAAALETIARQGSAEPPKIDRCTALFAGTVDVTGEIVARTNMGRVINAAGYKSLEDLGETGERFAGQVQAAFNDRLSKNKVQYAPLAEFMAGDVLADYWRRAPGVLQALREARPEPPTANGKSD